MRGGTSESGRLVPVTWTDGSLEAGTTTVKAVHVTELRTALGAVYAAYGFSAPSYTDSTITTGETTLKKLHVSELRAAAIALDLPTAATPSFSPTPGTFNSSQNITLSSTTSGAAIRYTIDGSEPTIASSLYGSPLALDATTTVRAKTFAAGHLPSAIATGTFTFEVAAPTFSPAGGTYVGAQSIEISSTTPSVTLRYTTDGSDPTASSTVYTSPIGLNPISTTTIKARGFRTGWTTSAASTATYVVNFPTAATPTASPGSATYATMQSVELSTTESGATIRYTVDGNDPTESSPVYSGPLELYEPTTVKARTYKAERMPSAVLTSTYAFLCGEAPNPNDDVPDDDVLNCLIENLETVTLTWGDPGYIIATGLTLANDDVIIQGDGGQRPKLVADEWLDAPMLKAPEGTDRYVIRDVIFDGNRINRQLISNCDEAQATLRIHGYNLFLRGAGFTIHDIYSVGALCGSAMEVSGSDFHVTDNHILSNGYQFGEGPTGDVWSDGITVLGCYGGEVSGNILENNTDIDLIVGDGQNCEVRNNHITHSNRYGFAGLMIGFGGDRPGSVTSGNHVTSGLNLLSIGLMIGHHPWDEFKTTADAGEISGNEISGAVTLMWIEG